LREESPSDATRFRGHQNRNVPWLREELLVGLDVVRREESALAGWLWYQPKSVPAAFLSCSCIRSHSRDTTTSVLSP